ncbi:MAG: diguanylate cyclase [Deltaproteobacteria bacterium]|nr:diguanylate cyclase [Deltaproteobacteria bacterium]
MTDQDFVHEETDENDYVDTTTTQAFGFVPLVELEQKNRSAALLVLSGRSAGRSFTLTRDETLIGRTPESEVRLDDDGVSRRHAKVVRSDGQWIVMDLGSTNGTYHDGERVQVLTLYEGAKIQLGMGTILRFQQQDVIDEKYAQQMYESKTRDPLTEAYNKGYFKEAIEREIAFAHRHQQPLSLVMLDIDHFKKVNDTYGHQAGDLVLKIVASSIMGMIRKEDVFARYGGEEFALLLRNTAAEMAFILAERVRRMIEKLEIVHNGRRIPCTMSLGIACTANDRLSPDQLIEGADARLYQAKGAGRNRTESALFD